MKLKLHNRFYQHSFSLSLALAFILSIASVSHAKVHHIKKGHKIQAAIDAASSGDTIIVHKGTYTENIRINKPLTIKSKHGFKRTYIKAGDTNKHVVTISASHVTLKGFSIYGATGTRKAGIYLDKSASHCIITKNRIGIYNYYGILLSSSNNNQIYLNTFSNNTKHVASSKSSNKWVSPEKLTYKHKKMSYKNHLGNFFDDQTANDKDKDGIGSLTYTTDGNNDTYPLLQNFDTYADGDGEVDITPIITFLLLISDTSPISFTANPGTIHAGETSLLQWDTSNVENVESVVIEPGIGSVALSGETFVSPIDTTTYKLTATQTGGETLFKTTTVRIAYPPTITVTQPDGVDDEATTTFIIKWTDDDPDQNATISLYYDTDSTGNDGTLIVSGIFEDPDEPGNDEYVWNTSGLQEGSYYIYVVIDDGENDPVIDYSAGPVTITHPPSQIQYIYDAMGRLIKIIKTPQP